MTFVFGVYLVLFILTCFVICRVCMCGFCNVCVCVCVCGFCNALVCVCVGFVMCGCVYVSVL